MLKVKIKRIEQLTVIQDVKLTELSNFFNIKVQGKGIQGDSQIPALVVRVQK